MCTFEHPFADEKNPMKADRRKIEDLSLEVSLEKFPKHYGSNLRKYTELLL